MKVREKRKELTQPWDVDPDYLMERFAARLSAIGYRLRGKYLLADLDWLYNNSANTIEALNRFLEASESDLEGMLDAISALNATLFRYHLSYSSLKAVQRADCGTYWLEAERNRRRHQHA